MNYWLKITILIIASVFMAFLVTKSVVLAFVVFGIELLWVGTVYLIRTRRRNA